MDCPLIRWTNRDIRAHLASRKIPLNPVYGILAMLGVPESSQRLGPVLDTAAIRHGRMVALRRGWPDLWAELVTRLPRLAEFG